MPHEWKPFGFMIGIAFACFFLFLLGFFLFFLGFFIFLGLRLSLSAVFFPPEDKTGFGKRC